jgi:hypothetical protein
MTLSRITLRRRKSCKMILNKNSCGVHRFERITRYNLGLASIGKSLETVGSYANNS